MRDEPHCRPGTTAGPLDRAEFLELACRERGEHLFDLVLEHRHAEEEEPDRRLDGRAGR